jgi:transposase
MDYRKSPAPTVGLDVATLYVALELSLKTWLVALRSSAGEKVSLKQLAAGDQKALFALIDRMQGELYAAGYREVRVVSCYEAGRDGFWLHRGLLEHGVESLVVDAASVAVPQHGRRRKTDRLDVRMLLRELMALMRHESDCRVLRVPTPEDEDERQLGRERQQLVSERVAHVNRIKGLLATQGIVDYEPLRSDRHERLAALRTALNQPLEPRLGARIVRVLERLEAVMAQLKQVEAERDAIVANPPPDDAKAAKIIQLAQLKSIANETATTLTREVFYRRFGNRRQVGAFFGFDGSPWSSGQMDREQGISKRGNRRVRALAVEAAQRWVYQQPDSALSQWFRSRVGATKGAYKRKMIVALARKLMIALWRYLETGLVPTGAVLKPAAVRA